MALRGLLAVYSVPHISQVHMWYRAQLQLPDTPQAAAAVAQDSPTILRAEELPQGANGEVHPDAIAQCVAQYGFAPGHETSEAGLFPLAALPWDELAFPSGARALRHYVAHSASSTAVDVGDLPNSLR